MSRVAATFHSVDSPITAGKNVNLYNVAGNMTLNQQESSILTRLKQALNPVTSASYDSYEADQRSECFPNTRVQVLYDIETWLHMENHQAPIYVLDGVAGIGKSTISQTVAVRAAALGLLGASFFFSRDEDQRKIARHFFPTIAYQLCCYDEQYATRISQLLEQHPDAPSKRLHQQLSLLLLEPLQVMMSQNPRPTLVVIDALDECEEDHAQELLSLLGQYAHRMSGLKILITTRPEWHIRGVLDQDRNHERFRLHEVEESIVHSDIRLYLQSQLSAEEIRKVSRNRQTSWHPTVEEMKMLCGICGTLFIIAATATKFILDRKRLNPQKQLSRLLDGVSPSYSGSKYTDVMDETYLRIIFAARSDLGESDDSEDWFKDLNRVLGALIILANPLPYEALASLIDMDPDDVEATLSELHSLVAPSGIGKQMIFRIHHKSFPDFITDERRIQGALMRWNPAGLNFPIWIDVTAQHLHLAKACLNLMNCNLKFNMAQISQADWFKDKTDIPHVIPQLIPPDLAYAVLHWGSHLLSSHGLSKSVELQEYLDTWASNHILAWIEVVIILDKVDALYHIMCEAVSSVERVPEKAWSGQAKVQELLSDACRFIQQGRDIMKLSPMHIYRSCLPFVPFETSLYATYGALATLRVGIGKSPTWSPLLVTFVGHLFGVNSVAFSSKNSLLASGSDDMTIRLWDTDIGSYVFTLTAHSGSVSSVAFSSDGSKLASGSNDRTLRLWDVKNGSEIAILLGHSNAIYSVAFSYDNSLLATGSDDRTIRVWDTKTYTLLFTLTGHSKSVCSVAFSSSNYLLASGSEDGTVRLWDAKIGTHISTLTGHLGRVSCVVFSPHGDKLASGSEDGTVRLWDPKACTHKLSLSGHLGPVYSVAFSSDGTQLASGSEDRSIRLWDAKTGNHTCTLVGHSDVVHSIVFSSDNSMLASGSKDNTTRLWDLRRGTGLPDPVLSKKIYGVALSGDGSQVATGFDDGTIQTWNKETGAHWHASTLTGHAGTIYTVAFSYDGSQLAAGFEDGTILLWNAKTGARVRTLIGHSNVVYSLAFSTHESLLASGSYDTTARIWNTETGTLVSTLTGHSGMVYSVAFSGDDSHLASGSYDKTIRIWDTRTSAHIFTLTGHSASINSVAFSSDGSRLASSSWDKTVRVWNAKTGAHISTLNLQLVIKKIAFLRKDSSLANQATPSRFPPIGDTSADPISLLLLIERPSPFITGLVIATMPSREGAWHVSPICWFPPDLEAKTYTLDHSSSRVGLGCRSGRVILLDFSSELSQTP